MLIVPANIARHAAEFFTVNCETGCHDSNFAPLGPRGYRSVWWRDADGREHRTTAHRAAWVHYSHEQVPESFDVDHQCRRPCCVRREHLRAIPAWANGLRRGAAEDWPLDQCRRGHQVTSSWCALCATEAAELASVGMGQRAIAARFGVSQGHVSRMIARLTAELS